MKAHSPVRPPEVSVIIAGFSPSCRLADCLESINSQTIASRIEVLLVASEDAATTASPADLDASNSHLASCQVIALDPRESDSAGWNHAVRAAAGEFLCLINRHDRLLPQAIEHLLAILKSDPTIKLVYGDCNHEGGPASQPAHLTKRICETQDYCLYDLLRYNFIGSVPLWRRTVHDQLGGFNEELKHVADYDLWLRLAASHAIQHLRRQLYTRESRRRSLDEVREIEAETQAVQRCHRKTIALERIFPALTRDNSAELTAIALTSMADLCLEGPSAVDRESALEFLNRAALQRRTMQIDNNRAVLLANLGRRAEARAMLEGYRGHPTVENNLQWLSSLNGLRRTRQPILFQTRHAIVSEARIQTGIDPRLCSRCGRESFARLSIADRATTNPARRHEKESRASVLIVCAGEELTSALPPSNSLSNCIDLARALAHTGCEVALATPGMEIREPIDCVTFVNPGRGEDAVRALREFSETRRATIVADEFSVLGKSRPPERNHALLFWQTAEQYWPTSADLRRLRASGAKVVCGSVQQQQRLIAAGIAEARVRVNPPGIDPRVFYARPAHRDHCRICCVRTSITPSETKALAFAFQSVRAKYPHVVIDVFGDLPAKAERASSGEAGIHYHGSVSPARLAEAFSRSSLTVVLSDSGTVAMTYTLGALACACPVLATCDSGSGEVVLDQNTGRLIEDASAESISEALISMLLDPLRLRIWGEAGRTRVAQNYLWEHTAERFIALIQEKAPATAPEAAAVRRIPVIVGGKPAAQAERENAAHSVAVLSKTHG